MSKTEGQVRQMWILVQEEANTSPQFCDVQQGYGWHNFIKFGALYLLPFPQHRPQEGNPTGVQQHLHAAACSSLGRISHQMCSHPTPGSLCESISAFWRGGKRCSVRLTHTEEQQPVRLKDKTQPFPLKLMIKLKTKLQQVSHAYTYRSKTWCVNRELES